MKCFLSVVCSLLLIFVVVIRFLMVIVRMVLSIGCLLLSVYMWKLFIDFMVGCLRMVVWVVCIFRFVGVCCRRIWMVLCSSG